MNTLNYVEDKLRWSLKVKRRSKNWTLDTYSPFADQIQIDNLIIKLDT